MAVSTAVRILADVNSPEIVILKLLEGNVCAELSTNVVVVTVMGDSPILIVPNLRLYKQSCG